MFAEGVNIWDSGWLVAVDGLFFAVVADLLGVIGAVGSATLKAAVSVLDRWCCRRSLLRLCPAPVVTWGFFFQSGNSFEH